MGLGSNLGDRLQNLRQAYQSLRQHFTEQGQSKIYASAAVDYVEQPPFYNLAIQFAVPSLSPRQVMQTCLAIEGQLGRQRIIPRGPRNIDIDLLFWRTESFNLAANQEGPATIVPHPRAWQRSFVFFLIQELPAAPILQQAFSTSWATAQQGLSVRDLQPIGTLN